jgi:hypothetical protein
VLLTMAHQHSGKRVVRQGQIMLPEQLVAELLDAELA